MESSDSDSYASENMPAQPIHCLIGKYKQEFDTVGQYWSFIREKDESKLDMYEIFSRHGHHGYIRIVNYLRQEKVKSYPTTNELLGLYNTKLCEDIKYLQGSLEEDLFIIYSGDLDMDGSDHSSSSDGEMPDLCSTNEAITGKAESASQSNASKSAEPENADTARLQELLQATIMEDNFKQESKLKKQLKNKETKKFDQARDDDYFDGYGDLNIHCEMISDYARTETYRKGIEDSGLVKDKIVIDVGAGSGILSMFAARAGAKHVYAIEPSAVASDAQEIITENGLADKITIIRKLSEDLTLEDLNGNKPDVIISEWMGYFLYFEGMLPSVIKARKYFGNTALMLPQRCKLNLGLLTHPEYHEDMYKKWTNGKLNPWGFKFSPLARYCLQTDTQVDTVPHWQVTGNCQIHELDLNTAEPDDVDFKANFNFKDLKGTSSPFKIYGMVGWFSTDFTDNIVLDTSPKAESTHWRQTVFLFKQPLSHNKDQLKGSIDVKRLENNRDLEVRIKLFEKKFNRTFLIE